MKRIVLLLSLFFSPAVFGAETGLDRYLAELVGPQAEIIAQLERLSRDKNYRAIYELLGSDYTSDVTKEQFVSISEKLSWTFAKLDYGTLDASFSFAWMPVRGIVKLSGNREIRFDTVVFFAKERGDWKLTTFPFLRSSALPHQGAVPRWLVEADRIYSRE
jgi:hypothetical protein